MRSVNPPDLLQNLALEVVKASVDFVQSTEGHGVTKFVVHFGDSLFSLVASEQQEGLRLVLTEHKQSFTPPALATPPVEGSITESPRKRHGLSSAPMPNRPKRPRFAVATPPSTANNAAASPNSSPTKDTSIEQDRDQQGTTEDCTKDSTEYSTEDGSEHTNDTHCTPQSVSGSEKVHGQEISPISDEEAHHNNDGNKSDSNSDSASDCRGGSVKTDTCEIQDKSSNSFTTVDDDETVNGGQHPVPVLPSEGTCIEINLKQKPENWMEADNL